MGKLKLPIGIQTFEKMRSGGYAYVDKTAFVASLARDGTSFFLSRPRRFGKSLFVDTLDCAFSGRREIFAGLYLDSPGSGWSWTGTRGSPGRGRDARGAQEPLLGAQGLRPLAALRLPHRRAQVRCVRGAMPRSAGPAAGRHAAQPSCPQSSCPWSRPTTTTLSPSALPTTPKVSRRASARSTSADRP